MKANPAKKMSRFEMWLEDNGEKLQEAFAMCEKVLLDCRVGLPYPSEDAVDEFAEFVYSAYVNPVRIVPDDASSESVESDEEEEEETTLTETTSDDSDEIELESDDPSSFDGSSSLEDDDDEDDEEDE